MYEVIICRVGGNVETHLANWNGVVQLIEDTIGVGCVKVPRRRYNLLEPPFLKEAFRHIQTLYHRHPEDGIYRTLPENPHYYIRGDVVAFRKVRL